MNVPPCNVEEFTTTDNNTNNATQPQEEVEERVHRHRHHHHLRRDVIPRAVPRKPSYDDNIGLLLPYYDGKDDNGQEVPVKHSTTTTTAITSRDSRTSRNKSLVVEEKQKMHPTKSVSHQSKKLKRKVRFYDPPSTVGPKYSFDTSEEDDRCSVLQEASAASSSSDSTSSYLLQKQIFQYPAIPRECYPEVFWTRSEQKVGLAQQKAMARFYTKRYPQLVASVYSLYGYDIKKRKKPSKQQPASQQQQAGQPQPPGEMKNREEDSPDHDPAKHFPIHSLHDAQTILTESESRGLEPYMTSLISQHRHWGIAKVLTIQQVCREKIHQKKLQQQHQPSPNDDAALTGDPKIDALEQVDVEKDSMETILSIWSQRVSQATCRYARHLGLGDQAVAYQLQLEENESNADWGHGDDGLVVPVQSRTTTTGNTIQTSTITGSVTRIFGYGLSAQQFV